MAVHDTEENGRSEYTEKTLSGLSKTVDIEKHRFVFIDNNSCNESKMTLISFCMMFNTKDQIKIITLPENIGTARAINMGIKLRNHGENVIKMDNDVVVHQSGWVEQMEEAIERDASIGIVGLKRKDLRQTPYDPDPNYRSEYVQLPHVSGQKWIAVEVTNDIMGTCTIYSSALLDKSGYLQQPSRYGFDDNLISLRSRLLGFKNCFLPHIEIDHIDRGDNPYSQVKIDIASMAWAEYQRWHTEYCKGTRSLYYNGGFNE